MCTYSMMADSVFRHNAPWTPNVGPWHPLIPSPVTEPGTPWGLDRLKEFDDVLRRVKTLEEKLGIVCEANKADYLSLLKERIADLESKING